MAKNTKGGLGRGLESLFGSTEAEFGLSQSKTREARTPADASQSGGNGVQKIRVDNTFSNPEQPRKFFDKEALDELAESIRQHGVLQPILVSRSGSRYIIIAGERRWRASKLAGLTEIPAVIYEGTQSKEVALIENLQREDLNAIEAANAVGSLMAEYRLTQESVAARIGKSRPYVTNLLRLLELAPEVQSMIAGGRLSMGHAKAILSMKDRAGQLVLAQASADGKMSVRELEKAAKNYGMPSKSAPAAFSQSIELKELKNLMQRLFGTKVEIFGNDNKGRIYIDYYSRDDIDRIAEIIETLKR